jgi:hypothetical protein
MSLCIFSIDNFSVFTEKPRTSMCVKDSHFTIEFDVAYCANDNPSPTLRWKFTWNDKKFEISCAIVNNVKTWSYGTAELRIVDLECVFRNHQKPVLAFCDEFGKQYMSLIYVRGTLQFSIELQE